MSARVVLKLASVALVLAVTAIGCVRAPSTPGSKIVGEVGRGTLTGHQYTNDYFKLTINLPEPWYVQSQQEMEELQKMGSQLATGKGSDPNLKRALEAAQTTTMTLVTAFEQPPGTPIAFNSNFMVMAERVTHLPGIKSGAEYCEQLKKSLDRTALKYQFDPMESGHKIGSLSAHCLPIHTSMNGLPVNQRYYAARHKDYVLAVIISYSTEEQRQFAEGILAGVKAGP